MYPPKWLYWILAAVGYVAFRVKTLETRRLYVHQHDTNPPQVGNLTAVWQVLEKINPENLGIPIHPTQVNVEQVQLVYQLPEKGIPAKGLYILFHGCNRDPADWFLYPEELLITRYLLLRNYAVAAFGSQDRRISDAKRPDRTTRCWDITYPPERNIDAIAVAKALSTFVLIHLPRDVKIYAAGASSGGTFATILAAHPRLHGRLDGMVIQVAQGNLQALSSAATPPAIFMWMSEDKRFAPGGILDVQVAIQTMAKSYTRPKTMVIELHPRKLYQEYFSDYMTDVSVTESHDVFGALVEHNAIQCAPAGCKGACTVGCCLCHKPGAHSDELYEVVAQAIAHRNDIQQTHLWKRILETLNAAYAFHEVSGEKVDVWEDWLYKAKASVSPARAESVKEIAGMKQRMKGHAGGGGGGGGR